MQLLLRWLRPDTLPSPRRNDVPFGTKLRISLYRDCMKKMREWYSRYAFSDTVDIQGSRRIKIVHEFRDPFFEAELKRLRLSVPDILEEQRETVSSVSDEKKWHPFYKSFQFKDTFRLEINGKKVFIEHGDGRTFTSNVPGRLKESSADSLIAKYAFSGSLREEKPAETSKRGNISTSISGTAPKPAAAGKTSTGDAASSNAPAKGTTPKRKAGSLFGDDPLFGRGDPKPVTKPESKPEPTPAPPADNPPHIKVVIGGTIDESF